MDFCFPHYNLFALQSLPSAVRSPPSPRRLPGLVSAHKPPIPSRRFGFGCRRKVIVAASGCEFSGLNTPLEPKSPAGRLLSRVLQSDVELFRGAVDKQLEGLASDRDDAIGRMNLRLDSDEAFLHWRIAELRGQECQVAIEDVMYMMVLHKFDEIGVHLVPRLSTCVYNGRLEIWPSRDWQLESIHSFEVLEMIREHLTAVIGWRSDSSVTDNWATTQIPRLHLCQVYAASILYGYFLKSASLRHHLELNLAKANHDLGMTYSNPLPLPELWSFGLKDTAFGYVSSTRSTSVGQESCSQGMKHEELRGYVMGFNPETLQMCAKPKTKEAASLIAKHSCALFGDEKTGLIETDEVIQTSLSSLKRMVLEAVAFGSFLWDTEEYVDTVYKLTEN
ncbi:phosphoserine aminotransferase, putative [Actinidia rufa]|uniref:Phosphoserine aminotransferase, putative n=1 Tax=Actinidia rufa TaxID=165716 RepID=A0A7J0GRA4_9ERIC|nr:phosphoserine aminotransferase, putative [Actinidia rufa]